MITLGVDQIENYLPWIGKARVGLLTNITGRNSKGQSTISILKKLCNLTALFGPEHGVRGDMGAGDEVAGYIDQETGLPVYSLYKNEGKHFSQEMLDCFDVLVYDIQDVGVRFYTYISTLHNALMDCAKTGKRLIVLDRPNPLGGEIVEGGLLDMEYSSFVGSYPLPIRYALTAGEVAQMINEEQKYQCDLKVVPIKGWKRSMLFGEWERSWPAPSLALLSYESALCYPGTCLVEGTNLSEGRGTAAPFRLIGAGYVDAEALTEAFCAKELEGVGATPIWFTPTTSKWKGEKCGGVLLHILDEKKIRPVTVGITLLELMRTAYPEQYQCLPPYREGGRPMLSLLSGGNELLGDWDADEIIAKYQRESREFEERKKQYHIYQ